MLGSLACCMPMSPDAVHRSEHVHCLAMLLCTWLACLFCQEDDITQLHLLVEAASMFKNSARDCPRPDPLQGGLVLFFNDLKPDNRLFGKPRQNILTRTTEFDDNAIMPLRL